MATWWRIQAAGVLICLFTIDQQVSSFNDKCWNQLCVNGHCVCAPQQEGLPMWSIPVIFFCVLTIGCACFTMLCKWCCKACREEDVVNNPQEPIRGPPIPPPAFAPPTPSANQFRDPPPYNEVAWKPYLYPPPVGQPPAYDNIAMVDLSFVDISQPPASVPKVTSEELYVSATTMPEH